MGSGAFVSVEGLLQMFFEFFLIHQVHSAVLYLYDIYIYCNTLIIGSLIITI